MLFFNVDRLPLVCASRALGQLPVVTEQQVEITHVEFGRVGGPGALDAGSNGIGGLALHVGIDPAEALILYVCGFRLWPKRIRIAVTVRFTHGVATGGQCSGFFVVHGHTGEGFANLLAGLERIGIAVYPLRVHVNQAHLNRGQRVFHGVWLVYALVAAVRGRQPLFLCAPVDVFLGVPNVLTAVGEAKGFKAHGLIGNVTGKDKQVGPAYLVAILFLDRPQQAASLIKVAVIGPGIQRSKTLVAGATATTAVGQPVGARRVPRHTNHQTAIVTPICRPPILAVGHQLVHVLFERFVIEFFDFFAVVEVFAHRVCLAVVLVQDVQIQVLRPPGRHIALLLRIGPVHDRALTTTIILRHRILLFLRHW